VLPAAGPYYLSLIDALLTASDRSRFAGRCKGSHGSALKTMVVQNLFRILLVAVGSACGGVLRWIVGAGVGQWLGTAWPWGTFLINISGSMFLGWFLTRLDLRSNGAGGLSADQLRLLIGVGFTGGYTTFSSFEWESLGLLGKNQALAAAAYIIGSAALGLLGVYLGAALARPATP
jgi:CrcB protein